MEGQKPGSFNGEALTRPGRLSLLLQLPQFFQSQLTIFFLKTNENPHASMLSKTAASQASPKLAELA